MTFWKLIRRNLSFHARAHFGVVLGAAIGSAALIGALVVGDSVREILHLRQRKLCRSQSERQDWGVGWIGLAVNRRGRQVRREICARGIDGLLHLLLGHIDA